MARTRKGPKYVSWFSRCRAGLAGTNGDEEPRTCPPHASMVSDRKLLLLLLVNPLLLFTASLASAFFPYLSGLVFTSLAASDTRLPREFPMRNREKKVNFTLAKFPKKKCPQNGLKWYLVTRWSTLQIVIFHSFLGWTRQTLNRENGEIFHQRTVLRKYTEIVRTTELHYVKSILFIYSCSVKW